MRETRLKTKEKGKLIPRSFSIFTKHQINFVVAPQTNQVNGVRTTRFWMGQGGSYAEIWREGFYYIRNYFVCLIDTHFVVVNQMRNNTSLNGGNTIAADIKLLFILFPRAHWISMPSVKHRFVFRIILSNQIFKPVGIFRCSGFQISQESTDLLSPLLRGNGAADSQNQIFFLATFNERHNMF